MTKHERAIRKYLTTVRDRRKSTRKPEGWVYCGDADFLLQHGVMFSTERGMVSGHFPGECYGISRRNAEYYEGLFYVEGLALSRTGIPTEHAWNLTASGAILDEAWGYLGSAYFGVAFKTPKLRAGQRPSMLDPSIRSRNRHPVYSVPWESNRLNPALAKGDERKTNGL